MLTLITTKELREAGESLREYAKKLDEYADRIDESEMQEFYYHWVMFRQTTMNGIADYLDELNTAINKQVRAHGAGAANPYKREKEKAERDPRTRAGRHKAEQDSQAKSAGRKKKGA